MVHCTGAGDDDAATGVVRADVRLDLGARDGLDVGVRAEDSAPEARVLIRGCVQQIEDDLRQNMS